MRHYFQILIVVAIIIISFSCGKYPCARASLKYNLVGFSDSESDTIILRRFDKNSQLLKDTTLFDEFNPIRFARFADTLMMVSYSSKALLESAFDYELFLPGAGKTYIIRDITEEQSYGQNTGPFNTDKTGCINQILSYKLNGQLLTTIEFPNSIYLVK